MKDGKHILLAGNKVCIIADKTGVGQSKVA